MGILIGKVTFVRLLTAGAGRHLGNSLDDIQGEFLDHGVDQFSSLSQGESSGI